MDLSILEKSLFPDEGAVSFREFIESPEFMDMGDTVYEFWKEEGTALDDPAKVVLDGSLGGGKSTFAVLYSAFRLYKLFRRGDVARLLGMAQGSEIYLIYFSVSETAAERGGFSQMRSYIDRCKWFQNNFPRDKKKKSTLDFSNNVHIISGSSFGHQLGLNIIGFILDEANFRKGVGQGMEDEYAEVTELAGTLIDRQITRFATMGKPEFFSIIVSSASYASSFTEKQKELAKTEKYSAVITSVAYKVKPESYSKETFELFTGYGTIEPCIVQSTAQHLALLHSTGIPDSEAAKLFINPPESIKNLFIEDPYRAMQNHCGIATSLKGSFITSYEVVKDSYLISSDATPLIQGTVVASNHDDVEIAAVFDETRVVSPERPHSLFLDLSVTGDMGGLTMVRYDGDQDNVKYHSHVFTLEIIPPAPPAVTDIAKVKRFIVWLCGVYNVTAFGSDNYQSMQLRQEVCQATGLEDIRVSLDSSDVPFTHWLHAIVEKRYKRIFYSRLDKEIKEAEHDLRRRRVVKRRDSSDDLFQTEVGAFFLSDTVSVNKATSIEDLYPERINIIGSASYKRMLSELKYTRI